MPLFLAYDFVGGMIPAQSHHSDISSLSDISQESKSNQQLITRISIPSLNIQKSLRVGVDEQLSVLKNQVLVKIATGIPDGLNYGFSLVGADGKERFLDDHHSIVDYGLPDNVSLEFKLKHRNGVIPGSKGYDKDNNKKTQKKLLDTIKDGNVDEVKSKLSKGTMDPNFVFDDGVTPLVLAVLLNERDMITALLENGAIKDFRSKSGAFTNSGVSSIPNQFGSGWFTPMHVAACENRLIALQTLMYYAASPNVVDSHGLTPLYHASALGHQEMVKWILIWAAVHSNNNKLNIDKDVTDSQGRTALHLACTNGFPNVVQMLVEHGFDIHAQNSTGNTPLHVTCTKPMSGTPYKECVRILLTFGAEKDKKNRAGQTSSQIALMSGNIDLSDYIKKWTAPPTGLQSPTPVEVLVDNSKNHWQNVRKVMNIGQSPSIADNSSEYSLNERSRTSLKPSMFNLFNPVESSKSLTSEISPRSLVEDDNRSDSFARASLIIEKPIPPKLQSFVPDSISSSYASLNINPSPLNTQSYVTTSQSSLAQPSRGARLPPPPPLGATPKVPSVANIPSPTVPNTLSRKFNTAGMPFENSGGTVKASSTSQPSFANAFENPQKEGASQVQNSQILAQLMKIEEEKKRLELEVEKLKQQMMSNLNK